MASYIGFDALKKKLAKKGIKNPGGLAYKIGAEKYGKAGMAKKAAAGRRKKESRTSRLRRIAKQKSL